MPPPLALAFVPTLLRVGPPSISSTTQSSRPNSSATFIPARRGLAFTDAWQASSLPVTQRYRHSASAREKISHANKGNTPWNKGRKHSEETRAKISQATRAAMEQPHVRDKLRRVATGRKHSEETKRKIRRTSRLNRANDKPLHTRLPRRPVPFCFDDATVARLDARITKRYRVEYTDRSPGVGSRPKRPMPEETRRKLSERIRALWAEDENYRERVAYGIEQRARKIGKSTLSEAHKQAISRSLRAKHASRREQTIPDSPRKTTRKPRKPNRSSDPALGTRFALDSMSDEDREALTERRKKTNQAIVEAEAEEEAATFQEERRIANQARSTAEREAIRSKKEFDEVQKTNRMLLESLAMAGQLPSLEEECAMVGSSFLLGSETQTEVPYLSMGNEIFLEDEEPFEDPLLVPPESNMFGKSDSFGDLLQSASDSTVPLVFKPPPEVLADTSERRNRKGKHEEEEDLFDFAFY